MKTGLIMEGGAMRGMFTSGVTDVLLENGIIFDGAIGVSAGAAFGCNYKSCQIGRAMRYNVKYCKDSRYCSIRSLLFTGDLFGKDFCYYEIPDRLDIFDSEAFDKNPMPFYLACTNLETGEPVYKKYDKVDKDFPEWVRASASLPCVSRIVEIDGLKLQDGGISDSIPLRYFESIGYNRNVVILTQPKGYVKGKTSLNPFIRHALKNYPKMLQAIANRHVMYNDTVRYIEEKEKRGEVIILRPKSTLPIKRITHDPKKLTLAYELGRTVGNENIEKIKEFLNEK